MRVWSALGLRAAAFSHDLLMVPVAWFGAYWIRFNLGQIPHEFLLQAFVALPVLVVIQGSVFMYFGLYRGVWRFASLPDLIRILRAVIVGVSISVVCVFLLTRMHLVPRSTFLLYAILLVTLLGGPRLVYRWIKDRGLYHPELRNALIVGAGRAGERLARDLISDKSHGYTPVAFVDDDKSKRGQEIHGVRVVGACRRIPELVNKMDAHLIVIALPSATSRQMRSAVEFCEQSKIPFRTLPRIQDLVAGRSMLEELREVSIEDLLGREPVSLDWASIEKDLSEKVVLISGGGGSIGSELCRQISRLGPASLVIVDSSEFNLYTIETELREKYPNLNLRALLTNMCDKVGVERAVQTHRPDVIFHAAAYKHVPILETQLREAVRNNILGTRNIALSAAEAQTPVFVLVSTDKAVNPISRMGLTKRAAEILCQTMDKDYPSTRYITVRFGNVLESAGSVVPRFRKQIATGGPVTVTHRDVKRYFMTIPESCQLIMEAAGIGEGGEVFVLDMGEPIKISYLAEQMILLSGRIPGKDIEIVYTGLRPGEKMFEEVFHDDERLSATGHDKLLLARKGEIDRALTYDALNEIDRACKKYDEEALVGVLAQFVDGSTHRNEDNNRFENVIRLDQVRT